MYCLLSIRLPDVCIYLYLTSVCKLGITIPTLQVRKFRLRGG